MSLLNSLIVVGSEVALALYPILIKTIPTSLDTQLFYRFLVFTVFGFVFASSKDILHTWGTSAGLIRSFGLGALTLFHVAVSYYAFEQLPTGTAMSLFYTYPIWNLVGAMLGFQESFHPINLLLIGIAFIGTLLVAQQSEDKEKKEIHWKGISAALLSAITESAMYFAVRTAAQPNAFFSILELYPAGFVYLLGYLFYKKVPVDFSMKKVQPLVLFNLLIGFLGYAIRFYAIPRVSTLVFSSLSFFGVIASFAWGNLFISEVPTLLTGIGASLIIVSSGAASFIGKN
jgi:drug/metabolite transporter (DMT)-like permease